MPDPTPTPEPERTGKKIDARVTELERTVTALVKAIKDAEDATGEPLMPIGTYCGVTFDA